MSARARALREHVRTARSHPSLLAGMIMLAGLLFVAFIGPSLTSWDPLTQNLNETLLPPSAAHLFGTDGFGRDVFARVVHGTRTNLGIGLLSLVFPFSFGLLAGAVAGYSGGVADTVLMRIVDTVTAFPGLVLVIAVVAFLGGGMLNMILAISLVAWVPYARLVRAEVLAQKPMEYVQAARILGYSRGRVIFRHILPNAIMPALVFAVSNVTAMILAGAGLGFLGLGVKPPAPEWGMMISEGQSLLYNAWWIAAMPLLACLYAGTTFTLLGDGVADVLRVKGQ